MRRVIPLLLALALLTGCAGTTREETPAEELAEEPAVETPVEPETPEPVTATLAVCGDVMSHMPVTTDAWDEAQGRYDYGRIMAGAADYVAGADYAVANLETTLAGGPNYSGYPAFNSPDDLAYDLKDLGFDLLMTCNNHCLDKGKAGALRTLDVLDEVGLTHVGTSRSQEEYDNNVQVADVGGISVAFLAYTYGTNGIPVPSDTPYLVNLFNQDYLTSLSTPDTDKLTADLAAAKALGTDLVAVMIHWGIEYQTSPNSYQQSLADLLIENGADLVLGGHSHVPQSQLGTRTVTCADGSERQGFVSYSLGNFISSQNDPLTDTTAVLTLELTKDPVTGETSVTDYRYRPMLMLDREEGPDRFELLDVFTELKRTDLSAELEQQLRQVVTDCGTIWGDEHMDRS